MRDGTRSAPAPNVDGDENFLIDEQVEKVLAEAAINGKTTRRAA